MVRTLSIIFQNGRALHWNLDFSAYGTLQMSNIAVTQSLPWVKLDFCKCPACTLDSHTNPTCPVAEVLASYARDLADRKSFEKVRVQVIEEDGRHILLKEVALQTVVGELVRVAVYQSGCPVGRKIKPSMVRLHPFPDNNELLEALALFFALQCRGSDTLGREQVDFIQSLHEVFGYLSKRLEHAGKGDVYLNAVVIMHSLSMLFSISAPELIQNAVKHSRFW